VCPSAGIVRMKQAESRPCFSVLYDKNSEIYREFFEFHAKIAELCPNMQICVREQGINREFSLPTRMNKEDWSLDFS
jgi:hypothetical protein